MRHGQPEQGEDVDPGGDVSIPLPVCFDHALIPVETM